MNENETLVSYLAKITREEDQKEHDREINEKLYLPQCAFNDCMSRALALDSASNKRRNLVRAYSIAIHRETSHDEDHSEEIKILSSQMQEEDIKACENGVRKGNWWSLS